MTTLLSTILGIVLILYSPEAQRKSDREHDSLKGDVHEIRVSVAKLTTHSSKFQEGKREFLQSLTYDRNGALLEKAFLVYGLRVQHRGRSYRSLQQPWFPYL